MTRSEVAFSNRAIRRKKFYLPISIISVLIGIGLAVFYAWQAIVGQDINFASRFVIVILILLSARQNLRQHYYVNIIEKLMAQGSALQPTRE